jgi:splicing factor 3A subunit 1
VLTLATRAQEQYTIALPDGISAFDLDVIKLTAQFVARNGKSFLTGLTSREHLNPQARTCGCIAACVLSSDACFIGPQFNFLKPTHSMFTFFTALADAYSKVLMPPKSLNKRLQNDATDRSAVLDRCLKRLEWERTQERCVTCLCA